MTQPQTVITHGEITSLTNLVRAVRQSGIAITSDVEAELEIRKGIVGDGRLSQQAHTEAISKLYSVPAKDFDKVLAAAADATARLRAEQELTAVLEAASVARLSRAVAFATADWELAVVDQLKQVVEDFDLNSHAPNLPNIAERGFSPLNITGTAGAALEAWRNAGPLLQQRCALLRRLADLEGQQLGPDRELSTNLTTIAVLGDAGSWNKATAAADTLAVFAAGADSVKPWRSLSPWIVTALHGFPLEFATVDEAARRRRAIQPSAAIAVS